MISVHRLSQTVFYQIGPPVFVVPFPSTDLGYFFYSFLGNGVSLITSMIEISAIIRLFLDSWIY